MPTVPKAIDRQALWAALESLGIDRAHLRHIRMDAYSATLTYLALNSNGKPYAVDGGVAEFTYDVPIRNSGGVVNTGTLVTVGGHEGQCSAPA